MKRGADIEPRMLTKDRAAAYCGVSAPAFAANCPVPPVAIGNDARLVRWDRKALDAWLDELTGFVADTERLSMAELRMRDAFWIEKAERELSQKKSGKRQRTN